MLFQLFAAIFGRTKAIWPGAIFGLVVGLLIIIFGKITGLWGFLWPLITTLFGLLHNWAVRTCYYIAPAIIIKPNQKLRIYLSAKIKRSRIVSNAAMADGNRIETSFTPNNFMQITCIQFKRGGFVFHISGAPSK